VDGDDLIFPQGLLHPSPHNDIDNLRLNSITISGRSGTFGLDDYVINENTFHLDSLLFAAANLSPSILNFIVLTGSSTAIVSADPGQNLDLNGSISGSGGIRKTGDGVVTLFGDSSYTGRTTVAAGTLAVLNPSALGAVGPENDTAVLAGARLVVD